MKKITSFLSLFAFLFMVAVPAMAAEDSSGIVQLSDPSKIFNDDGTVTVTYDLPLSPYSLIYGQPVSSTEFVQVGTSTNIYFTQDKDEWLSVYTAIESCAGDFIRYEGAYGGYVLYSHTDRTDFSFATHFYVDGQIFPAYDIRFLSLPFIANYSDNRIPSSENEAAAFTFFAAEKNNIAWVVASPVYHSLSFGYYEDVMISQHEYNSLYPLLFPFGRSNYIDVSNIRSGGSFEVSVTYDYNIILHGTDTSTDLIQHIDFYDKNFRLISTTSSVTTPFDIADGESSTINTMVTVPEGAYYMDMELTTDPFAVSDVQLLDWRVSDMEMTLDMSDVEANSLMMSGIIDRLDTLIKEAKEQNASLDEITQLLQDVIDNMGSAGSDQTEVKDLLQQLLEQQQQNGEQLTPTPEQSDKAEDLENDIRDEAASIENNNSMLEQLTPSRPVINTDLTLDPVFLASASPLIANIWSISGMGRIIGVVLAVATVAYIFFGKRDG